MSRNIFFMLRRFSRQKLTTFLHIAGLSLGITVCLLIGLFIRYEKSFDTYETKADRTYRVNQVWVDGGKKSFHYSTPFPLADEIRKDIPGLENVTKVHHPFNAIIEINPTKRFRQDHVMLTDPEFLDVFDVKAVEGNPYETLRKPNQAILTETTAKKFFGNEDALGKTFTYNNDFLVTVGAVIKDFPGNTHLPAELILSLSNVEKFVGTSLTYYGSVSGGSTFIVLPEGVKPGPGLLAGLRGIYDRFVNNDPGLPKDSHCELELQPLSDVHFNAKYAGGGNWVPAINQSWLWFFGAIGIAVLLLACINFVNLSTAQALTRAKEVGVRKTIGAGQFRLLSQFIGEALLLVTLSSLLAIVIAKMVLPSLNTMVNKHITFDLLHSPGLLLSLLAGICLTALLAGFYPAWLITGFRPAATLKSGSVNTNPQSSLLRKGLVIAQFSISVCLLIGLLLIGKQMNYMRTKNLGFDKENIVLLNLPNRAKQKDRDQLATRLAALPGVKEFSFSTSPPSGDEHTHWGTVMSEKGLDDPGRKEVTTIFTDDKYCSLYNLQLKAGRFFTAADTTATSGSLPEGQRFPRCVVNEKLVLAMGYGSAEASLGKRFWIGVNGWTAEITGVVKDFNVGSLHEEIKPTLITQFLPFCDKVNVKMKSGIDLPTSISSLGLVYKDVFPKAVFEYNFLDDQLDALYKSESQLYNLFKIFSVLAMLISCLGLWGLITLAAQQRVKEIGIRKVLGASVANLVTMLARDFVLLVVISIVIASPLAYWGVNSWLKDFAFRIHIGWTVFAIAAAIALLIALLTVSYQAIRAAMANPVKSLHTE